MCLIITAVAAVISTLIWKLKFNGPVNYNLNILSLMYTAAALMWCCDGVASVLEGESFFDISLDDTYLGLVIVFAGIVFWGITFLWKKVTAKAEAA